ncbi:hypothetical protein CYMTET_26950 [Cymbomonas tetramitiformis]|uniref:Uncharacterized protein n=1 Tax=Cymbomonas tetramitiformis TaxID=36881 RepID=A0AAE0KXH3_9CHLO|nr:hypothetical protein CYMTET_26950 [Cymbomonas tetramitiformis]
MASTTFFGTGIKVCAVQKRNTVQTKTTCGKSQEQHNRRNALAAVVALPALLAAQSASAKDPIFKKIGFEYTLKDDVCAKKVCKVYPGNADNEIKCLKYVSKGKEFTYAGETSKSRTGAFENVDCDVIINTDAEYVQVTY